MMRTYSLVLLLILPLLAVAEPAWKLRKEDNGISIYTAANTGSDFKMLKVELAVDASANQVLAFLMDIERQPEWIYGVKSAKMLATVQPGELIYYSQIGLPWPCSSRDYVAHLTIARPSADVTTLDSHAQPDYIPEKKGLVRVRSSVAHWEIKKIAPGRQLVTYTLSCNPGGLIPPCLINMFLAKGPSHTFRKFREHVADPRYRAAQLAFLNAGQ